MEKSKQQRCQRQAWKYPYMRRKKLGAPRKTFRSTRMSDGREPDEEAARSEKTAQKRNEHYEFMLRRQSDLRLLRKFQMSCKLPLIGRRRKSSETDRNTRMTCAAQNRNRARPKCRGTFDAVLRNQHQLARRLPRLHEFVRLCRLRQRERLAYQQLELALGDQLERFLESASHQLGHGGHRVQREGAHLGRFLEQLEQVERLGRSARASIENQMPKRRKAGQPFVHRGRADGVQDQIDAAP